MALNRLNLEFIRRMEHGLTSKLMLLGESDGNFVLLRTLTQHFAITRQRDAELGGYVDRCSVRLPFDDDRAVWNRTVAINLITKTDEHVRYRLDAKSDTRQTDVLFGFAQATMIANEKTTILLDTA